MDSHESDRDIFRVGGAVLRRDYFARLLRSRKSVSSRAPISGRVDHGLHVGGSRLRTMLQRSFTDGRTMRSWGKLCGTFLLKKIMLHP